MTIGQVCAKYGTHMKQGLSEAAAEGRLRRDGPNTFTPPKDKPWYILFLKEISGGFALLLWLAAIGSFVSFCIEHKRQDVSISEQILIKLQFLIFISLR